MSWERALLTFGVSAAGITELALGIACTPARHVLHEFAGHLRALLATGGVGTDLGIGGQVENGGEQACKAKRNLVIRTAQLRTAEPRQTADPCTERSKPDSKQDTRDVNSGTSQLLSEKSVNTSLRTRD